MTQSIKSALEAKRDRLSLRLGLIQKKYRDEGFNDCLDLVMPLIDVVSECSDYKCRPTRICKHCEIKEAVLKNCGVK